MLAQGGDQLVLAHRRAAFELQLPSPLAELLNAALLVGTPVRRAILLGRLTLGRSWPAVVAQGGDQFLFVHRRAAFELQLTRALPELLEAALLIGPPVGPAVLPGRLSRRRVARGGLRLLRAL